MISKNIRGYIASYFQREGEMAPKNKRKERKKGEKY